MQKPSATLFLQPLLALYLALTAPENLMAQELDPLLFDTLSTLELTMPVDFDALCRPSENPDCEYTPTVFIYRDAGGNERSVPISIRRRDGWRAMQTNCQIPTLFVRFFRPEAVGTPFEGQTELALTSHCGKGISPMNIQSRRLPDALESYVINEYLGYRLYNLVSDISLRVRLVRIRYKHPDEARLDFRHYAFFAEHFDSLAARFDGELLPSGSFDPARLDLHVADRLALFQFMVGNTDWSIPDQENIILIQVPDGRHVPVLFDLDMSGLVFAHYASPAPDLPIRTVKERYYMGYCNPEADWDALFDEFSDLRPDMVGALAQTPGLGLGDRRMSGTYLDSFFNILGSREARQRAIIEACQPWPP